MTAGPTPYPYNSFEVSLRLGNEAMQSPRDVIDALRRVAQMMENGGYEGSVLDDNGNTVGSYRWIKEPDMSVRCDSCGEWTGLDTGLCGECATDYQDRDRDAGFARINRRRAANGLGPHD